MTRYLRSFAALAGLAMTVAAVPGAVAAQEIVPPPTPNADRLADAIRQLARDPRDVAALITAGEMSAVLEDPAAAAGFFARAEALDAFNPRLAAGRARLLLRLQRPGEALQMFALAEQRGLPLDSYASDRGLAYDLVGNNAYALREHRRALASGDRSDEAVRRHALSLGIARRSDEAMTLLDPLLRRSDRAAWRARAFIMALSGDIAGAERIAASMMGAAGRLLTPFLHRLGTLPLPEQAFAVHFGQLRRTPVQIADANRAPRVPPLPGERPVQFASNNAPVPAERRPRTAREIAQAERIRNPSRTDRLRIRVVEAAVPPVTSPALPPPPPVASAPAAIRPEPVMPAPRATARRDEGPDEPIGAEAPARIAASPVQPEPAPARSLAVAPPVTLPAAPPAPVSAPPEPVQPTATTQPLVSDPPAPAPVPVASASVQSPASDPPAPAPAPVASAATDSAAPPPARVGREDSVLAAIISGITIPASELGVAPLREPAAPVAQPAPAPPPPAPPPPAPPPRAAPERARPATPAPPQEPARYWVQIAISADRSALAPEWRRLSREAPEAMRGKTAWTAPLNRTNRLLTGPFENARAAQAFVNDLRREGLSSYSWRSAAGEKVERVRTR